MAEDLEETLNDWVKQQQGWGLLFAILPLNLQLIIFAKLSCGELGEYAPGKDTYEAIKTFFETWTIPIPRFETTFSIGDGCQNEREKILNLKFTNGTNFYVVVKFLLSKKRHIRNLVEMSAEIVGKSVEQVENLEIPETLKEVVAEKIIDAEWLEEYWIFKHNVLKNLPGSERFTEDSDEETVEGSL